MSLSNEDKQFIKDLFSGLEQRIDRLEMRLDKIEQRLDSLEIRMDSLELRLEQVEIHLEEFENRLDNLEKKVEKLDTKIDMTRADVRLLMANIEVNTDRINDMHVDVKVIRNDTELLKEDRDHVFSFVVPRQLEHEKRIMGIEGLLLSDSKKV